MARRQKVLSVQAKKSVQKAPPKVGVDFYTDPKPKRTPQPWVFCTLNPETDEVFVEMHEEGSPIRHTVKCDSLETIKRVLLWRKELIRNGEVMLMGEDGNPTQAQIEHWENHSRRTIKSKLESNCPFCITEARNPDEIAKKTRKYDTRGNLIQVVKSASEMGFSKAAIKPNGGDQP